MKSLFSLLFTALCFLSYAQSNIQYELSKEVQGDGLYPTVWATAPATENSHIAVKGMFIMVDKFKQEIQVVSHDNVVTATRQIEDTLISEIVNLNNNVYTFYTTDAGKLFAGEIDNTTLENKGTPAELVQLIKRKPSAKKIHQYLNPKIYFSNDHARFAIVQQHRTALTDRLKYQVDVFNSRFEKQYEKEVLLPMPTKDVVDPVFAVGNDGSLIIGSINQAKNVVVLKINDGKYLIYSGEEVADALKLDAIHVESLDNGSLKVIELLTNGLGEVTQSNTINLDNALEKINVVSSEIRLKNSEAIDTKKDYEIFVRDAKYFEDGRVLIVTENIDQYLAGGTISTRHYQFGNINVLMFDAEGNNLWNRVIAKKQGSIHLWGVGTGLMHMGDASYFFYNEKGNLRNAQFKAVKVDHKTGGAGAMTLFYSRDAGSIIDAASAYQINDTGVMMYGYKSTKRNKPRLLNIYLADN